MPKFKVRWPSIFEGVLIVIISAGFLGGGTVYVNTEITISTLQQLVTRFDRLETRTNDRFVRLESRVNNNKKVDTP